MRLRNLILAGTGILIVCGIAVAMSLHDYTSQPAVASAHIAPVVRTPAGAGDQPSPLPTMPVTAEPAAQPANVAPTEAAQPAPAATPRDALAALLQQLQQRRHHKPG